MAERLESRPGAAGRTRLAVRVLTGLVLVLVAIWAAVTTPGQLKVSAVQSIADRMSAGESLSSEVVDSANAFMDDMDSRGSCWPSRDPTPIVVRFAAVRKAEAGGDNAAREKALDRLEESGLSYLGCAPTDGYAWLMLFYADIFKTGVTSQNLRFLTKSSEMAPRESWIILNRLRIALPLMQLLSPPVQQVLVDDYAKLMTSNLAEEAAQMLVGPGRRSAARLLDAIGGAPEVTKQDLRFALGQLGFEAKIPGLPDQDSRPWR